MSIGVKDESNLGANVMYAKDVITLRGRDARNMEKKRLQPGDRLADGTIWSGNSKLDGLKKVADSLRQRIEVLQLELDRVFAQIMQLESSVIDDSEINPGSPGKAKTKGKKRGFEVVTSEEIVSLDESETRVD